MAPKSKTATATKPVAETAPKPEADFAGQVARLLDLDNGASEAAILAAVESLTKAAETKIAELTEQQKLLATKEEDYSGRLARIVERERAATDQETSLKQEADRLAADLAVREQKVRDQEAALAERERDVGAKTEALRAAQEEAHPLMTGGGGTETAVPTDLSQPPEKGKIRVTVIGPKTGRYRLGRQFTPEPVTLDLTKEEFEAVDADPKLQVSEV